MAITQLQYPERRCKQTFPEPYSGTCGVLLPNDHYSWPGDKCFLHTSPAEVNHSGAVWDYVRYRATAHPGKSICLRKLHFKDVTIGDSDGVGEDCTLDFKESSFTNVRIENWTMRGADFDGCTFQNCRFEGCEFVGANFNGSSFSTCVFLRCKFSGSSVTFRNSTMSGAKTPFQRSTFEIVEGEGKLDFGELRVSGTARVFSHCKATAQSLSLERAWFDVDDLHILIDYSADLIDWSGLRLRNCGLVTFSGLVARGEFSVRQNSDSTAIPQLSFVETDFSRMGAAQLLHMKLSNTQFLYSNVESVRFVGCVWPVENEYTYVVDERDCFDAVPLWREVERLYGQLKRNYERNIGFIQAGHWHYREIEARRRVRWIEYSNKPEVVRWLRCDVVALSAWYKRISNYGESQKLPLAWIVGVFVVFAVGYSFLGVRIGDEPVVFGLRALDFGMLYSFYVMTFQLGKGASAVTPLGQGLSLVQLVLTAIVVPLFLLAVRRKFRR